MNIISTTSKKKIFNAIILFLIIGFIINFTQYLIQKGQITERTQVSDENRQRIEVLEQRIDKLEKQLVNPLPSPTVTN